MANKDSYGTYWDKYDSDYRNLDSTQSTDYNVVWKKKKAGKTAGITQ